MTSDSRTGTAPVESRELDELWEGLNRPQRRVSSKYFYDERGSELFERITELDEYYPTRTERELLRRWSGPIVDRLAPRTLVELGAGSARKTRLLLDAMARHTPGARYMPVDVSGDFLSRVAERLRSEYAGLEIVPRVADFTETLELASGVERPAVFALLGSTIGNFRDPAAMGIVRSVRGQMGPRDHFLLGIDLRPGSGKTVEELERAYDDAQGVTAAFNRNLLVVLNDRFGSDFDPADFAHRAFWNESEGRIEMHLVARRPVEVSMPDRGSLDFREGETLRTEISRKYDRPTVEALFLRSGLRLTDWLDAEGRYALALGRPDRR